MSLWSARWAVPVYARELFLAVSLAAAGGCSIAPQLAPPAPSILKQPPIEGWTAEKLVQILSQRDKQFHSLRTLATVNYRGPEGRQGFQEAVLIQRPDRLRLETLSGLGAILVVTANVLPIGRSAAIRFTVKSKERERRSLALIPLARSRFGGIVWVQMETQS